MKQDKYEHIKAILDEIKGESCQTGDLEQVGQSPAPASLAAEARQQEIEAALDAMDVGETVQEAERAEDAARELPDLDPDEYIAVHLGDLGVALAAHREGEEIARYFDAIAKCLTGVLEHRYGITG